jgi:hypothetical protein
VLSAICVTGMGSRRLATASIEFDRKAIGIYGNVNGNVK